MPSLGSLPTLQHLHLFTKGEVPDLSPYGFLGKLHSCWASLVAQLVKDPPAIREIWVQSQGGEDSLKKGKATHSSVLAWRIPWTV